MPFFGLYKRTANCLVGRCLRSHDVAELRHSGTTEFDPIPPASQVCSASAIAVQAGNQLDDIQT